MSDQIERAVNELRRIGADGDRVGIASRIDKVIGILREQPVHAKYIGGVKVPNPVPDVDPEWAKRLKADEPSKVDTREGATDWLPTDGDTAPSEEVKPDPVKAVQERLAAVERACSNQNDAINRDRVRIKALEDRPVPMSSDEIANIRVALDAYVQRLGKLEEQAAIHTATINSHDGSINELWARTDPAGYWKLEPPQPYYLIAIWEAQLEALEASGQHGVTHHLRRAIDSLKEKLPSMEAKGV